MNDPFVLVGATVICTSASGWLGPDATTRPARRPAGRLNSSVWSPFTSTFCSGAALEVAIEYTNTWKVPGLSPVRRQDPDASVVALPNVPLSGIAGLALTQAPSTGCPSRWTCTVRVKPASKGSSTSIVPSSGIVTERVTDFPPMSIVGPTRAQTPVG